MLVLIKKMCLRDSIYERSPEGSDMKEKKVSALLTSQPFLYYYGI